MKTKYLIGLLVALILCTGFALAQKPTPPPEPPEPPESADEPFFNSFSLFTDGGYLGVYAENINRENMARYHMSTPRGVGITQVIQGSPAEKAGLKKDDVIVRLDGENITSVRKLNRLVSEIAPDQSVRVTVSRGGAEQEVTATIGKRNNVSTVQGPNQHHRTTCRTRIAPCFPSCVSTLIAALPSPEARRRAAPWAMAQGLPQGRSPAAGWCPAAGPWRSPGAPGRPGSYRWPS